MDMKVNIEIGLNDLKSLIQAIRNLDQAAVNTLLNSVSSGAPTAPTAAAAPAAAATKAASAPAAEPTKKAATIRANSTYYPLHKNLKESGKEELSMKFTEIEKLIGKKLPESARKFRAWWANNLKKGTGQSKSWVEAGYKAMDADIDKGIVRFRKFK
jgi:phosphate-selective porin